MALGQDSTPLISFAYWISSFSVVSLLSKVSTRLHAARFCSPLDASTLRETQDGSGRGMSDGMLMRLLRPTTGRGTFTLPISSRHAYVRLHTMPTTDLLPIQETSGTLNNKLSLVLAAGCTTRMLGSLAPTLLVGRCLYTHVIKAKQVKLFNML